MSDETPAYAHEAPDSSADPSAGLAGWPGAGSLFVELDGGLYATTASGDELRASIRRTIRNAMGRDAFPVLELPPLVPARVIERADYLSAFPHLIGAVRAFDGDRRGHLPLLKSARDGGDWGALLGGTGRVLPVAACHGVYDLLRDSATDRYLTEVRARCFRHESDGSATRLQSFEMVEYVCVGPEEEVRRFADSGMAGAVAALRALGLAPEVEVAHDPFFGIAAAALVAEQQATEAKQELVVDVGAHRFAAASVNRHGDHFGEAFGISCGGEPAHSACVAFGIERLMLAVAATNEQKRVVRLADR